MKVALISFSKNGAELSERIAAFLRKENENVTVAVKCAEREDSIKESVREWTEKQFPLEDAILFVGAAGIAVRSIAPMVESKCKDPAVLVIDEKGMYCIPILSGHIGGANALAQRLHRVFGMEAVITTATDIRGKWAVDVFAKQNHLQISDMRKAKEVSARILAGEKLRYGIEDNIPVLGKCPEEIEIEKIPMLGNGSEEISIRNEALERTEPDIYSGIHQHFEWKKTLFLVPKTVIIGIGCKKGTSIARIEQAVDEALQEAKLCKEALKMAASIDLKAKEEGILAYCEKYQLPFQTYTSEELLSVKGVFTGSEFVKKVTGVENICERSALCASEGGKLLSKKYAKNGVTVAFAEEKWEVAFE